jgi:hypothetical protein
MGDADVNSDFICQLLEVLFEQILPRTVAAATVT